jgi:hypothetical protein
MVPVSLVPDNPNGDHAVAPVDDPLAPPPPGPAAVSTMGDDLPVTVQN